MDNEQQETEGKAGKNRVKRALLWAAAGSLLLVCLLCSTLAVVAVQTGRSIWIGTDTFKIQVGAVPLSVNRDDPLVVIGQALWDGQNTCAKEDEDSEFTVLNIAVTIWRCHP